MGKGTDCREGIKNSEIKEMNGNMILNGTIILIFFLHLASEAVLKKARSENNIHQL